MISDACAYCGTKLQAPNEPSLNQEFLEHGMKEHATKLNDAIDELQTDGVDPTVVAAIVRYGED